MHKPTDTGTNRTGIATSPFDGPALVRAAGEPPIDGAGRDLLLAERIAFAREANPVGTVPPPASMKGLAKTVLEKLAGHQPTVFIDKLGQRFAYERTGVRLYDALLAKFDAAEVHEGGPTRVDLEQIRRDELQHAMLLRGALEKLGADPTAMTPCADVTGVASLGFVQALGDPRTTFTQCLDVMLAVEVGDVEGWLALASLADALGFDDLATDFRYAETQEERHAQRIREWVSRAVLGQAGPAAARMQKPKDVH